MLISSLIDIPSSLYRTFVIEEKFGFNKLTIKTYLVDLVKGTLLSIVIGVPLIMLVLWLMNTAGSLWWVYAWLAITAFSIIMMWAYPKFIAPIFNKFTPLEEGEVLNRITTLLERNGFNSNGVFMMDGSKRSSHGNAYFTGFGKTKRIVFFDTLLKQLTPTQIEAVLAHELGHFKHKHVLKGMVVSMTMTLVGFGVLAYLMQQAWFYTQLGVNNQTTYMALLLFMLVSPVFTFFIGPIMSWWSRKHEFEADAFAAKESSAEELISALVGLYKKNAGTLTPDPMYSAFYDSHPPASIRIAHLRRRNSFAAGDASKGETLFSNAKCLICHGTEAYTAPDRKINDLTALEEQVRFCDTRLNANWFDEDIHDVVAYLNQQYYKFPTPE